MIKIGLTGIPGSGKTTVLGMFAGLGAKTINVDEICHRLLLPCQKGYHQILSIFGKECLCPNGNLNHSFLRQRLLRSPEDKKKMEDVLHPLIAEEVKRQLDLWKKEASRGIVVVEVPLLFEVGWQDMFDMTVLVYADKRKCLQRLQDRGLDKDEAQRLIELQWPLEKKLKLADFSVKNNGTLEDTFLFVKRLWEYIIQKSP